MVLLVRRQHLLFWRSIDVVADRRGMAGKHIAEARFRSSSAAFKVTTEAPAPQTSPTPLYAKKSTWPDDSSCSSPFSASSMRSSSSFSSAPAAFLPLRCPWSSPDRAEPSISKTSGRRKSDCAALDEGNARIPGMGAIPIFASQFLQKSIGRERQIFNLPAPFCVISIKNGRRNQPTAPLNFRPREARASFERLTATCKLKADC